MQLNTGKTVRALNPGHVSHDRRSGSRFREETEGGSERRSGAKGTEPYLFDALQLSEILVTFVTVKEGCEELLLELLGLVELLGLELEEEADDALCVPVTRTC